VNEEDEKAEKRERQRLEELLGKLRDKVKGHYDEALAKKEQKITELNT
jgi:ribosome recycling factor